MRKVTIFSLLFLFFAFFITSVSTAVINQPTGDDLRPIYQSNPGKFHRSTPARDEADPYMTFRFKVSADGGDTWSDLMGTGDPGMWVIDTTGEVPDTVTDWGAASYDFGTIVDQNNMLHFVAVLDAFSDYNPLQRVKGVYDVRTDATGENVSYNLIAEMDGDNAFSFSDVGVDADGNLYATWVNVVNAEYGQIWVSKSDDGGDSWSDPVLLATELPADPYPHITPHVGEYFYVLYQVPTEDEPPVFAQYVIKMAASMEGQPTITNTSAASVNNLSYLIGSVDPIDQDIDAGYIYFVIRGRDGSGVDIGVSQDGIEWSVQSLGAAQRYPSIGLDTENSVPWVFSNFGGAFGQVTPHSSWFAYDAGGYDGGDWVGPDTLDTVPNTEISELLYCHSGIWTTEGRLISGCNVWNGSPAITPSGYNIKYSDDDGQSWSESNRILSIWGYTEENPTLMGHFITQVDVMPGPNNYVWMTTCGQYGVTDIVGPHADYNTLTLSSVVKDEPWVVSLSISDALSGIGYADINWVNVSKTGSLDWIEFGEAAEFDSTGVVDGVGNGTYYFHMPSDLMHEQEISDGDSIWFLLYYEDGVGNATVGWENLLIVGTGWTDVKLDQAELPMVTELGTNYPNPFNNSTVIPFTLTRESDVTLSIYDISGRLIETLYNGHATAGKHTVAWRGEGVPSGIYFYALEAAGQRHINKMTLLK